MLTDDYSILKLTQEDINLHFKFLKDCVQYSYSSTSYFDIPKIEDTTTLLNWLQSESIYILFKNSSLNGLIVKKQKDAIVEFCLFTHPRTCKMSILQLTRAVSLIAYFTLPVENLNSFLITTSQSSLAFVLNNHFQTSILKMSPEYYLIKNQIIDKTKVYIEKTYTKDFLNTFEKLC